MEKRERVTVRVRIGGEEHPIKADVPVDYIQKIAGVVDETMTEIHRKSPNLTRHRVAILAAMHLADELERTRAEYKELLEIMEDSH